MAKIARYRIRKVGRWSVWFDSAYKWRFMCRRCGRNAHHATQQDCIQHANQHDCTVGSLW
jgi:hypothetical protein